jgi:hypothetical protein
MKQCDYWLLISWQHAIYNYKERHAEIIAVRSMHGFNKYGDQYWMELSMINLENKLCVAKI